MASNRNSVRMPLTSRRWNMITVSSDMPVTLRYMGESIQNTGMSSSTSRRVPPPMAVTRPTT